MAGGDYEWRRYWFDREGPQAPVDGYLTRPDEFTWLLTREQARQLSELTEEPCLVLLGEPGLGKSDSVRRAARALEASIDQQSEIVRRLDLRGDDNATLRARLFESDAWRAWLEGKTLHLFLDSFDETLSRDTSFHRLLVDELEAAGTAISRLRLRIVCRSAEWIPALGDDLRRLFVPAYPHWAGPMPRQMVLAQLRRRDVSLAAEREGLDPAALLREIAGLGLQSLAAVPLTLQMLIDAARETGRLPATRAELFEEAALRLVDTYDREQRYSESRATLSAGERLAVAQRIAAAAIFSGRTTIGTEPSRAAQGQLLPAEISGQSEEDPRAGRGSGFEIKEKHILEVLRTALFVDVGPDRVRFRHRSLAEYLASSYLVRHRIDRAQMTSLLVAPGDPDGRLIPQLREVAAWMAAMDPVALEELLAREPAVALLGDRLDLTAEQASRVVAALLTPEVAEMLARWSTRLAHNLRALDHPGLAVALRGPLIEREAPESVRRMAIIVTRACERRDLEDELLGVALEAEGEPALRAHAIAALGELGSVETRRKLVPLAKAPVAGDTFRQLQGAALSAVFPSCLDLEATLAVLTEPSAEATGGIYVTFLRELLPARIAPEDLPAALRWAAGVRPKQGLPDELNRLVDAILRLTWPRLQQPELADLTMTVLHNRLQARVHLLAPNQVDMFDPHFSEEEEPYFEHAGNRRLLIDGMVERIARAGQGRTDFLAIEHLFRELVRDEDRVWVLDRLEQETGGPREMGWECLAALFSAPPGSFLAALREDETELADDLSVAAFDAEIEEVLTRLERGDPYAWPPLIEALRPGAKDGTSLSRLVEREASPTALPGWMRAGQQTRERIVAAATAFLEGVAPDEVADPDDETGSLWGPMTIAGCSALSLLAAHPGHLDGLGTAVWERWAPVALEFPLEPMSADEDEWLKRLFAKAARAAPAELVRWVSQAADVLAASGDLPYRLQKLRDFRDPRLAAAVLPKLEDATLSPYAHVGVLEWTIDREPERSVQLVEPYLAPEAIATDPVARARAAGIAAVLLGRLPAVGWVQLKQFLEEDEALGIDVLRRAAALVPALDADGLPTAETVELVATVFALLPPAAPPADDDAAAAAEHERLDRMRGRLLTTLIERGADESVALVEELHRRYPQSVPADLIEEAKRARRRRGNALDPKHLVELCHANTARLVFDDRGLQDAMMATLREIQRTLREGESSPAYQLWNSVTEKPEYEGWISDWLAERLALDWGNGGRVINREVQAAVSVSGKGRAPTVDIKITAPTGNLVEEAGNATVMVEVKGAWHSELKSAMSDQLVQGYMLKSGHRHGIYLVLWFPAEGWDQTDSRRRWDGGMSFEEAEKFFAKQAEELSVPGRVSVRAFVLDCSR